MNKRKYGARNLFLQQETHTSIKRQRIQGEPSSDSVAATLQPSSQTSQSSTPRTALEAWLKPVKVTSALRSSSPDVASETPPSSPPLSASQSDPESPQLLRIRKPTFSFLRRQRPQTAPIPLSDSTTSLNIQCSSKPKATRDAKLTQLTIDLGGPTTISCPDCGMSYTPSQPNDAALHAKHHTAHLAQLNISAETWRLVTERACWKDIGRGEYIIAVSSADKTAMKNLAGRALAIASRDLGAVEISKTQLWSRENQRDRYRAFLYCRDKKCTGLLLAEHIEAAYTVLEQQQPGEKQQDASEKWASKPLELCGRATRAKLGVSRIWTCVLARRSGVALKLLETARRNFLGRSVVNRESMAFSQPTEMGTALARKWFGKQYGWLVYKD